MACTEKISLQNASQLPPFWHALRKISLQNASQLPPLWHALSGITFTTDKGKPYQGYWFKHRSANKVHVETVSSQWPCKNDPPFKQFFQHDNSFKQFLQYDLHPTFAYLFQPNSLNNL